VKLLLDENLSPRLEQRLAREFPGSRHVRNAGLLGAEDQKLWNYARSEDFVIVSKDTDFRERSYLHGAPPKTVWLDVGNAGTESIEQLLRRERTRIERFVESVEPSLLILSLGLNAV